MVRTILLTAAAAAFSSAATNLDETAIPALEVITTDIVIVGGGASGTYAAVRLREDLNTSVLVVEAKDRLGGHVNTYFDPITNTSIDYGVQAYLQYGNSEAFFKHFNIPIMSYDPPEESSVYVNSADGSLLSNYTPPSLGAAIGAIETWLNFIAPYSNITLPGLWDFPTGDAIPSALLLPFGDLAQQLGIQAAVSIMISISNVGVGGIKDVLTLYVMFAFGQAVTREFLNGSLFVPQKPLSNSALYDAAYELLQDDVMLQSRVISAQRPSSGVQLIVQSANGTQKLVKAKELLFTPPPSLSNLSPFDLDYAEISAYSTWTGTWSFAALARITSIPINTTVYYTAPTAAPKDYLDVWAWPFTLTIASEDLPDSIFRIVFATNYSITHSEAKTVITTAVQNLTSAGTFKTADHSGVDFLSFQDHDSVLWRQSAAQQRAGIVQQIYALQGHRSTWYSASLLSNDYTGNAWAFVETLLPKMLADLRAK